MGYTYNKNNKTSKKNIFGTISNSNEATNKSNRKGKIKR
jgi:hypothetical protein